MRMWMTNTRWMCRKHLLGEHLELHMFYTHISKGRRIAGFIRNNLLEPLSIKTRHDIICIEMSRRGYNHRSDMNSNVSVIVRNTLSVKDAINKIDVRSSTKDLIDRCEECRERYIHYLSNINKYQ